MLVCRHQCSLKEKHRTWLLWVTMAHEAMSGIQLVLLCWWHDTGTSDYRKWVGVPGPSLHFYIHPSICSMYNTFISQSILTESILLPVLPWGLGVGDTAVNITKFILSMLRRAWWDCPERGLAILGSFLMSSLWAENKGNRRGELYRYWGREEHS